MSQDNSQAEQDFEGGPQSSSATAEKPPQDQSSGETEEGDNTEELPSQAAAVHQRIRMDGQKELERDSMALLWSAIAAGISMSFSMVARGLLHTHLPESDLSFLIEGLGYTVGFIVVILARQQLFTENTVTAVLPVMSHPHSKNIINLARLWGVVLVGNLIGTAISAWTFLHLPMFDSATHEAFITIGNHVMENTTGEMFAKSILAGWLIATLVWVIPAADQAKVGIIIIMTYIMAIGGFPHIIVGASEIFYLVFSGHASWREFFLHFGGPTLAGNIIGGSFIFALISHAQIRGDTSIQRHSKRGLRHTGK